MQKKHDSSQEDEENEDKYINLPGSSRAFQNPWIPTMDLSSSPQAIGDDKVLRMMQKMGYKVGSGLGKNEQGIKETIKVSTNLGRRGLGLQLDNLRLSDEPWDFSQEEIVVNEKVEWLENKNCSIIVEEDFKKWVKEGPPIEDVISNTDFCDKEILENVFKAKDIFDELDNAELTLARARANPFETIRSVFFMNRAALKMANIDAACDFMFTTIEEDKKIYQEGSPVYFADVCAGPGGFTEYILWRKQWLYKGFGLTLRDEHDFRVTESTCASPVTFQALYGVDGRGDVCNPDNLSDFTDRVHNETEGMGIHFMMSDGGFCVDGQENLQEVLSKNIYICQCLLALNVLRPSGHFVTKIFDVFTPFSVGLLYLMYLCFERVGILKPNSSRPANSERYFICSNLKVHPRTNNIREYLWKIAIRLWEIDTLPDRDVLELVPLGVIKQDKAFFQYIVSSNCSIARKQIVALKKLAQFCRNPNLVEDRQDVLRRQCLEYWNIPDEKRKSQEIFKVDNIMKHVNFAPEILKMHPRYMETRINLESTIADVNDWQYAYLHSSKTSNKLNFYAGVGFSKVYRLQNNRWVKVRDLELPKGTLLFGDFARETSISENNEVNLRYSVHVIDAVFLGSMDLQGLSFEERSRFVHIFCKAVNKESQTKYSVRVRPKVIKKLSYIPQDSSLIKNADDGNFSTSLPTIGYKSVCDKYDVNSILLMKTDNSQSFQSTHVLRVQIFNTKEEITTPTVSFDELRESVINLLILTLP